ncbi:MAG: SDR family oxidoreductase, partial [Spirochaetales bacterium]|nr:SDR family oxidoreductase [Spirochaetales bacterium]
MILVTGITGRIGSSLAKYLLERGQEVGGLVRDPKQLESLPDGITGFVGDFEDPDSTEEA